ncbi:uncharacterized protein G2W53_037277 [Senna tora]|uniref:Uncharacterized protein n=1 Tax=Senna tora TaxID=362788 RepID=A0A834SV23_9FABA|nr:uncharacterized protein G2W53_037277 [Senna tora]
MGFLLEFLNSVGNKRHSMDDHRKEEALVWERIDKTFTNLKWLDVFPTSWVEVLPNAASDHSPLVIHFWKESNLEFKSNADNFKDRKYYKRSKRAQQLWLIKGDRNTRYFHTMVKTRKSKIRINAIADDSGNWTKDHNQMKLRALMYFANLYSSNCSMSTVQTNEFIK